jgi:hypothetical protein
LSWTSRTNPSRQILLPSTMSIWPILQNRCEYSIVEHRNKFADMAVPLTKVRVDGPKLADLTYLADGKRVICYFSAGAWDSYRSVHCYDKLGA